MRGEADRVRSRVGSSGQARERRQGGRSDLQAWVFRRRDGAAGSRIARPLRERLSDMTMVVW